MSNSYRDLMDLRSWVPDILVVNGTQHYVLMCVPVDVGFKKQNCLKKLNYYYYYFFKIHPLPHDWCNKGSGLCYPVWDGAYKRTLAANRKE